MAAIIQTRPTGLLRSINPFSLARHLWHYRSLIGQFTWREIEGRYRGSFLGMLWSLINPLFMLLIYTFVFGVVLKARWPQAKTDSLGEFALIIFCGLTAFNFFSECVNSATRAVVSVPNYVKKVVFPLEILPVSILGSALFHTLISLGILLIAELLIQQSIPWTIVVLPLVMLPLLFLSLGLSWFLASLGVFVRDIGPTVALAIQSIFFFTPIFYSIEIIPEPFRTFILYNPMAPIVENFRRVILWGTLPSWRGLLLWICITGAIMLLGYAWFIKTKKAFADVI